eukprot:CAMPEP_0174276200 /NCGR_PEP_ID=MMETSP0439-20130205/60254_1 /TAXON_ID=0 /ORGANISM="Stereomyxa ramosa, Strain Chinc5" /LENGTH=289 /DNA_ID=CAMNT_0015368397 /DNA_START=36 /DNA_END=905 /DNA_ORIENTATION=-
MGDEDGQPLFCVRLAYEAEMFPEMFEEVKKLISSDEHYFQNKEQSKLFSDAAKGLIGAERLSWMVLKSICQNDKHTTHQADLIIAYLVKVGKVVQKLSMEVISLINTILVRLENDELLSPTNKELLCFYYKLKADYLRYIWESCDFHLFLKRQQQLQQQPQPQTVQEQWFREYEESNKKQEDLKGTIRHYYTKSYNITKQNLEPHNTVRMRTAINMAIFNHDILGESHTACELARVTLVEALASSRCGSYTVCSGDRVEINTLAQSLKDVLMTWTSDDYYRRSSDRDDQ